MASRQKSVNDESDYLEDRNNVSLLQRYFSRIQKSSSSMNQQQLLIVTVRKRSLEHLNTSSKEEQ
jgi:hypothetical protein